MNPEPVQASLMDHNQTVRPPCPRLVYRRLPARERGRVRRPTGGVEMTIQHVGQVESAVELLGTSERIRQDWRSVRRRVARLRRKLLSARVSKVEGYSGCEMVS